MFVRPVHSVHGVALAACLRLVMPPRASCAQPPAGPPGPPAGDPCASANSADWNVPQRPFRVYGNTYYVGTCCLTALFVTSPAGHVLLDAGLPQSAPLVLASIRALGFRVEDVKLLLNSHAHFDHAGGLAAVQRASGAPAAASAASAPVLAAGRSGPDDPQYGALPAFPPLRAVRVVADGETVRVGPLALTAHATPGHAPGGTTWTWTSCEGTGAARRYLDLVDADSQTPISAPGFRYTRSTTYPGALADFARGQATLERLPCDVLLTPHPAASQFWARVAARRDGAARDGAADSGRADALVGRDACRRYAAAARAQVVRRVAEEAAAPSR